MQLVVHLGACFTNDSKRAPCIRLEFEIRRLGSGTGFVLCHERSYLVQENPPRQSSDEARREKRLGFIYYGHRIS